MLCPCVHRKETPRLCCFDSRDGYNVSNVLPSYGADWPLLFPALAAGRSGAGQAVAQVKLKKILYFILNIYIFLIGHVQAATMATTLAIAGLGGLVTGLVMRAVGRLQFGEDVICPASARFDDSFTFLEDAMTPEQVKIVTLDPGETTSGQQNGGFIPEETLDKTE